MQDAHVQRIPLHFDASSDPPRGQAVIGCFDLHAAIQMYDALTVLVVAEGFERQRKQRWFFLVEHGCHLPFRGAMNARIGPTFFPAIQISLRFFQTLEALAFEWSFLRVSDTRFYFPLAIGIFNPARHRHHAVVCEHIAKKWIECGIVDVRNEDSLAQIIEHHDARTPTEPTKCFLMEFGPDTRTRTE